MNTKLKKTIALFLSLVMIFTMSISVFADDLAPKSGSITIKNPQKQANGDPVTYKAYKIFELTYKDTNPAVPTAIPGGYPYSYYISKDSSWLSTVLTFATNDDILWDHDGDNTTDMVPKRGTGLALDPVYDSKGLLKGYNVSYDSNFDAADLAKALKAALDAGSVTPSASEIVEFDDEAKAENLKFGYYLVDPSEGALASLTSTDPDVVISDKNEIPKVDKVILEDEVENRPIFGETDPKYVAYELFHKTDANVEWGAGVDAEKFNAALGADSALDSLYTSAYGEPSYSTNPGNTAARKWSDLYKADVEANYIAAAKGNLVATAGNNALNPVNAGCTYIVEMIKGGESKGFAIITADGTTGLIPLTTTTTFSDGTNTTSYEAPEDLVNAELEGLTNEVKATGASIGETVKFKLVTKVPDMTGYKDYFFVMNDTMDEGLSFEADTVEVYLNKNQNDNPIEAADKLTKDTDYTVQVSPVYKLDDSGNKIEIKDGQGQGTGEYETTGQTEIRIIFKNMLQYWSGNEDDDLEGEPITVKYSATVNQKAILNGPNKNTAFMEFSNDPSIDVEYTPGTDGDEPSYDPRDDKYKNPDGTDIEEPITGEGPESSTETYVAQITLTKIDGADDTKKLSGAKFKITGESYQVIVYEGEVYERDDNNGTWYLLKNGTYTDIAPSSESIYTEFDGKIMEYVVDETKTEPAVNWYYFNTDNSEYELITTANLAKVPKNAVMYTKQYTEGLYKAKSEPTGGWPTDATIDDKYEEVKVSSADEKAAAEALQDAGTTFYVKGSKSNIDNYDNVSIKYKKVTDLINKSTDKSAFQFDGYTDDNGLLTMTGLGAGKYTIEELIAPEGYNILQAPITVVVTFDKDTKEFSATVDGATAGYTADTNTITFNVINNQGTELPETGGIGTVLFIAIGAVLFLAAGIILTTKKRLYNEG